MPNTFDDIKPLIEKENLEMFSFRHSVRKYIMKHVKSLKHDKNKSDVFDWFLPDIQAKSAGNEIDVESIANYYRDGGDKRCAIIDEIFTAICGEDFKTIILEAAKDEFNEIDAKPDLNRLYDKYVNVCDKAEQDFIDEIFELLCGFKLRSVARFLTTITNPDELVIWEIEIRKGCLADKN